LSVAPWYLSWLISAPSLLPVLLTVVSVVSRRRGTITAVNVPELIFHADTHVDLLQIQT